MRRSARTGSSSCCLVVVLALAAGVALVGGVVHEVRSAGVTSRRVPGPVSFRATNVGGLSRHGVATSLPDLWLRDGVLYGQHPTDHSGVVAQVLAARVSSEQAEQWAAGLRDAGVGTITDWGHEGYSDQSTAVLDLTDGLGSVRAQVYNGHVGSGQRSPGPVAEAHERLDAVLASMVAALGHGTVWTPDTLLIEADPADPTPPPPGVGPPEERDWTGPPLAEIAGSRAWTSGLSCRAVPVSQVPLLATAKNVPGVPEPVWLDHGRRWTVEARALLPGERGCVEVNDPQPLTP